MTEAFETLCKVCNDPVNLMEQKIYISKAIVRFCNQCTDNLKYRCCEDCKISEFAEFSGINTF
jgi:predicted amidophosphoribosyltransferase